MSAQGEIPIGDPMRDAWERYKLTDDYENVKRWAAFPQHLDGSLWAAFVKGWSGVDEPSQAETIARLTRELDEAHKRNRLIEDTQRINDFALAARVTELESRLAWHPVSEKPPQGESPKYSVGVEVVYDGVLQLRTLANYSFMDSSWRDDHDCRLDGVTHWREIGELPAAPNEAGK